jgi:hypothetical protein
MERKPSTRFKQNAMTRWFIPIILAILILGLIVTLLIAFGMPAG